MENNPTPQKMLPELKQRFRSETPIWFKRIRRVSITLSAVGIALMGLSATVNSFVLPGFVHTLCTWFIIAGTTAAAVSTTAKTSTP